MSEKTGIGIRGLLAHSPDTPPVVTAVVVPTNVSRMEALVVGAAAAAGVELTRPVEAVGTLSSFSSSLAFTSEGEQTLP